jgi:hypothetical protein
LVRQSKPKQAQSKPIEISRSGGLLRFQDWLIPHDQYLMDFNPDEFRSRSETFNNMPENNHERMIKERDKWN